MNFRSAVRNTPAIRDHVRDGLQALDQADRQRVTCDGRRLCGSVDLDQALRDTYPNAARWDYVVGVRKSDRTDTVVWLEMHPASSIHVDGVLAKLQWLKEWIRTSAPELREPAAQYHWVATGSVSFGRGSPQARKLAQAGLRFSQTRPTRSDCGRMSHLGEGNIVARVA
jgi:hypothetical protein